MHFPTHASFAFLSIALSLGFTSCTAPDTQTSERPPNKADTSFETSVKPLFEQRCVWCHGNRVAHGGLNLQDRAGTLDPARRFIVPGKPTESSLFRAITLDAAHPQVMPGDGWGITDKQVDALRDWIASGAAWPEGSEGRIKRKPRQIDRDDFL